MAKAKLTWGRVRAGLYESVPEDYRVKRGDDGEWYALGTGIDQYLPTAREAKAACQRAAEEKAS